MKTLLILIPVALYAGAWIFLKKYQRTAGSNAFASAFYNVVGGCFSFAVLFCIKGFSFFWNWQTLACAIFFGVGLAVYNGMKVIAASEGPLALGSMSTTLGAVIITMLYGFIFLNEPVTVMKMVAVVLVIASFIPVLAKHKGEKLSAKFIFMCAFLFIGNGVLTSVSKVAQQYTPDSKNTIDFIALYFFFDFISSAVVMLPSLTKASDIERKHVFTVPAILIAAASVGMNTMASLSNFYLSYMFPASIQFPITNVGIMIVTTVAAFFIYSEKPTKNTVIGLSLATAAVICLSFG